MVAHNDVSEHMRTARSGFPLYFLLLLSGILAVWAAPARSEVLIDTAEVEGIEVFRVETGTATYVFDKQAAALVQMKDRDGHDWIGFRPEWSLGLSQGDQGWFRGIPNLGSPDFGHTRRFGAISTTPDSLGVPLPQATIEASHGGWHATWEFFDDHAKMTLHRASQSYWLLYEGAPGGELGPDDRCWRADGQGTSCNRPWVGDIVNTSGAAEGAEWVFFADGTLDRSLFMAHPDDELVDSYFRKDAMTVFGFGRQENTRAQRLLNRLQFGDSQKPQLTRAPEVLILGFVESRDFDIVKLEIDRLYQPYPTVEELHPQDVPVAREFAEPPA